MVCASCLLPIGDFLSLSAYLGQETSRTRFLILLATQNLIPVFGVTKAASIAIALYVLHNMFYAAFAIVAGWLADRFRKNLADWQLNQCRIVTDSLILGIAAAALDPRRTRRIGSLLRGNESEPQPGRAPRLKAADLQRTSDSAG